MKRVFLSDDQVSGDDSLNDPQVSNNSQSQCNGETLRNFVHQYVSLNKPDIIQQKQIRSWRITWKNQETKDFRNSNLLFTPTNYASGILTWVGEYMSISLLSLCYWDGQLGNDPDTVTGESEHLHFSCKVISADFLKNNHSNATSNADSKARDKIHQKMIKRLRNDDYIAKLFPSNDAASSSEKLPQQTSSSLIDLCEASVRVVSNKDKQQLEERVHCSQDIAEAIRRSIFSTSDSALDIFDIILNFFPFLPYEQAPKLANRAKLRLLEDAMYDACELESEEVMVDELQINNDTISQTNKANKHDVEEENVSYKKKSKKSRHNEKK